MFKRIWNWSYYSEDINNLQVLCCSCHKIKTQNEKVHGCYVKINNTESSFNNQVQAIMDSELSSRYGEEDDEEEFNRKAEILTEYKKSFFMLMKKIIIWNFLITGKKIIIKNQ